MYYLLISSKAYCRPMSKDLNSNYEENESPIQELAERVRTWVDFGEMEFSIAQTK